MTRRIYLNSSHPSEFELSRRTLYNCHPWRQFTGDQRPRIYYPGIITHIIYYSGVRSRRDPTDFSEFETDFDWQIFAPIFIFFFGREMLFFFLPAKIYGALLHLMACWSISGHIYHIYFPDCPLFLDCFFFIDRIILKGADTFSEIGAKLADKIKIQIGKTFINWNMVVADKIV